MILHLDRLPVARQIVLVVLLFNLLVFAGIFSFISYSASHTSLHEAENNLKQQTQLIVQQFSLFDSSLKQSTRQLARVFRASLRQPLSLNSNLTVRVGDYASPQLSSGNTPLNNQFQLVDEFTAVTGGTATIFVRYDDDFLRISTSLKKDNGQRAMGTLLGKQHPGYQTLISGQPYEGVAHLFGREYMARYEPVTDSKGTVIAILYVGFDFTLLLEQLKQSIAQITLGSSGYVFAMDADTGPHQGALVLHPTQAGNNLLSQTDAQGGRPFAQMLNQTQGVFEAELALDGQAASNKMVAYQRFDNWHWVIGAIGDVNEFTAAGRTLQRQIWGIAIAALALLSVMTFTVVQSRLQPLQPLQQIATQLQKMGNGDLRCEQTTEIKQHHQHSRSEIKRLLLQSHNMRQSFSGLIRGLHRSINELSHASSDLRQITENSHQQIARQKEQADQVATAVSEMAASIRDVAANVSLTSEATASARKDAEQGRLLVEETANVIQLSADELSKTSQVIESLNSETRNVEEVLSVIQGIAEQTNLLALNAAIEAARAGEQGRGFAVVASEVRNLAQRTQESTGQIQQMIDSLQRQAGAAVQSVQRVRGQSQSSVEKSMQAAESIAAIALGIEQINDMTAQIASAAEQQSVVAAQIESSVVHVKESSDQNAVSAGETAAASESLSDMASALRNDVAQFSI